MPTYRKAIFIEQLPPTPCTSDMRQAVLKAAESAGVSVAEIQRRAYALFLSGSDKNPIIQDNNAIEKEMAS